MVRVMVRVRVRDMMLFVPIGSTVRSWVTALPLALNPMQRATTGCISFQSTSPAKSSCCLSGTTGHAVNEVTVSGLRLELGLELGLELEEMPIVKVKV
jgi:hypothetical protein